MLFFSSTQPEKVDLALIMKLQNRIKELEKEINRLNTEREREEEENKDKEHTVYNSLKVPIPSFFSSFVNEPFLLIFNDILLFIFNSFLGTVMEISLVYQDYLISPLQ